VSRNPLIVAVDLSDQEEAGRLAESLSRWVAYIKVGLELFTAGGPQAIERMLAIGPVFLDLKLHDIPNTVSRAARNVGRLGVGLLTVHALGGPDMVRAAVDGADKGAAEAGVEPPGIVAVTILSSLANPGLASSASLAFEAVAAGAAGAVVSGEDVAAVREALGPGPILVVPGIRPGSQPSNDHVRVLAPAEALELGADYIVVGRPITEAADPAAAAQAILREVAAL
jgi:orotidine-5'-phosphate decarboxylase